MPATCPTLSSTTALLGWSLDGETTIIPRDVLASKFSLDRISKNPATFDPKKLDWVNAEYINGMSDAQFADEIMVPELHEAGLIEGNVEYGEDWIDALAAIVAAHQDAGRRRDRRRSHLCHGRDARV